MTDTYRSEILAAVHGTAEDLHDAGVMEKRTLRRFDEMCLAGPCQAHGRGRHPHAARARAGE